jgi:hypothetical protein
LSYELDCWGCFSTKCDFEGCNFGDDMKTVQAVDDNDLEMTKDKLAYGTIQSPSLALEDPDIVSMLKS